MPFLRAKRCPKVWGATGGTLRANFRCQASGLLSRKFRPGAGEIRDPKHPSGVGLSHGKIFRRKFWVLKSPEIKPVSADTVYAQGFFRSGLSIPLLAVPASSAPPQKKIRAGAQPCVSLARGDSATCGAVSSLKGSGRAGRWCVHRPSEVCALRSTAHDDGCLMVRPFAAAWEVAV